MAQVVDSHLLDCSGCDAKFIVLIWSCGCMEVVPNKVIEETSMTSGHFEGCKNPRNRLLFSRFERCCSKASSRDREKDPPSEHADT